MQVPLHHTFLLLTVIAFLTDLATASTTPSSPTQCYSTTLPALTPSAANRTIPWGSPALKLGNGSICCDSLDQVRDGIDDVDKKLLSLLALRAGYVREATRFKATLDSVDVPSRDAEVVQQAVDVANETMPPLPGTVAKGVFEAILNFSVPFEECVFEAFEK